MCEALCADLHMVQYDDLIHWQVPLDGFSNGVGGNEAEPPQFKADGTSCSAPTIVPDACGTFTQGCTPVVDEAGDDVVRSFTSTFRYCGGGNTGDFRTGSAGWFNRTYTQYAGTECADAAKQVTFQEMGTMVTGKEATDAGEGAVGFQRWAPATTVTAYGDYVASMCRCGGTWNHGIPRQCDVTPQTTLLPTPKCRSERARGHQ